MGAEFFKSSAASGNEGPPNGVSPIRRAHRWIATIFLLTVTANFVAMIWGQPPAWITYAPLPPLFLLMGSGISMLIAPAVTAWRARRLSARR